MRRLKPTPLLGCFAILVDFIGLGMIAPILPSIVEQQSVGNILTAQYAAVVIGQLVIGCLADRFGRRLMIFIVMLFDAILFAATGFTQDVTALIILRMLAGISAPVALGISYVAEVSSNLPPAKRNFNFVLVGVSFNLGSLAGAATGGLLGAELWLPANMVAGVVPFLVAVWALATEDVRHDKHGPPAVPAAPAADVVAAAAPAASPAASPAATTPSAATKLPSGMSNILGKPEFYLWLWAYIANGFFQGGFFSLMPVMISSHTANASAAYASAAIVADGGANTTGGNATASGSGGSSNEAELIVASVIIASSFFQIVSNFCLVPVTLQRLGSNGHEAFHLGMSAIFMMALAILDASDLQSLHGAPIILGILATLFVLAYVPSASALTVLNQQASAYSRLHGAPQATMTSFGRSAFASAFGLAPAATIAMFSSVGAWLPLGLMSLCFGLAACSSGYMKARWQDPIPPLNKETQASSSTAQVQMAAVQVDTVESGDGGKSAQQAAASNGV